MFKLFELKPEDAKQYSLGCLKNPKHPGFINKLPWYEEMFKKGLKIVLARDEEDKHAGFLEYVPGAYTWRAIDAVDYLVIHCIFTYPKIYQNKGLGQEMIDYCIKEAKRQGLKGVATVAGDVAFIAHTEIFEKAGFRVVDAKDKYRLLVLPFDNDQSPKFIQNEMTNYKGLHMLYAHQCPLNTKYLKDITAYCEANDIDLYPHLIADVQMAQDCPNPLGIYALIYNNKLVADHPVSLGRFKNIVHKELGL